MLTVVQDPHMEKGNTFSLVWIEENMEPLSIFRQKRKPDLFVTIACDPNHADIQNALKKAEYRPDIVTRVFKKYSEEITEMVIKGVVPG